MKVVIRNFLEGFPCHFYPFVKLLISLCVAKWRAFVYCEKGFGSISNSLLRCHIKRNSNLILIIHFFIFASMNNAMLFKRCYKVKHNMEFRIVSMLWTKNLWSIFIRLLMSDSADVVLFSGKQSKAWTSPTILQVALKVTMKHLFKLLFILKINFLFVDITFFLLPSV